MSEFKRHLITAALPYANGPLHVGHIAGAYLPADIYARYLRMKHGKEKVVFICGSDEHGVPITLRAKKEGVAPQQVVNKYHNMMKESFKKFGISFDIYHRTSEQIHHDTAAGFFKVLLEKKKLFSEESEQFFDEEEQQFLADRYIVGTCPKCSNDGAYGDQCEKCGTSLSPQELIKPHSMLSGKPPVMKKTKHWYLPLDKLQKEWLQEWIESKAGQWKSNVFGQCMSWLKQGLNPRAVTRDLDWGVPVPLPEAKGKVLYVWFDAPIGYISAAKAYFENPSSEHHGQSWEQYWKDNSTKLVHFVGKDNIVFHCIIFPAMLKAHGEFILPENVPANEFLNLEGNKISTSRNWAVWLHEYLKDFPGRQDELRYVLCSIAPENKDSEFTWKDYQARVNNELADILGNYLKRVIDLTHKFCEGKVPNDYRNEAYLPKAHVSDLWHSCVTCERKYNEAMEHFRFRDALSAVMDIARAGNKYLADTEPWKLIKSDKAQVDFILHESLQVCLRLAYLLQPFLPGTSQKILIMLRLEENSFFLFYNAGESLRRILEPGQLIHTSLITFPRITDEEIETQLLKLKNNQINITPKKAQISFNDFTKMDLRIGEIIAAEKVKNTDKLLRLIVDLGQEKRTVVSGIAAFYTPEQVVGKKVCFLANLAPRKIRGVESHGMVLMAENEKGELSFITPEKMMGNGAVIR